MVLSISIKFRGNFESNGKILGKFSCIVIPAKAGTQSAFFLHVNKVSISKEKSQLGPRFRRDDSCRGNDYIINIMLKSQFIVDILI